MEKNKGKRRIKEIKYDDRMELYSDTISMSHSVSLRDSYTGLVIFQYNEYTNSSDEDTYDE